MEINRIMEQLSGLDSTFVHQDTARTPMHVSAVLIYDVGEDREYALDVGQLADLVSRQLSHLPVFRSRLSRFNRQFKMALAVHQPESFRSR